MADNIANHEMSLDDNWHVCDFVLPLVVEDVSVTVFPHDF